jgi:hypothetical protein
LVYQVLGLVLSGRGSQGPYLYATRDIPAGAQLTAADLDSANWFGIPRWPTLLGTEADALGHLTTTDLVAGQPISSAHLLANDTSVHSNQQRLLIQVASTTLDLVEVGNHIDIYLPSSMEVAGKQVASDIVVVAEIASTDNFMSTQSGALVVAAPQEKIQTLATIDASSQVNVVLRAN